jgi:hypothetical protein
MVSFSLRQRIILPPPPGPTPVSFHLSQFVDANTVLERLDLVTCGVYFVSPRFYSASFIEKSHLIAP